MKSLRAVVSTLTVVFSACAEQLPRPALDENYHTAPPTLGARSSLQTRRISYQPADVRYDPGVPVRTGPETIAVFEFAHPDAEGNWVAPHWRVILVEEEDWVDALEPITAE